MHRRRLRTYFPSQDHVSPSYVYSWQKKVISLDGGTGTHLKMTISYLWFQEFYLWTQISFYLEPYLSYIYITHVQIDLRTLNHRQIIAIIRRDEDRRVHVEQQPIVKKSTIIAAAVAIAVAVDVFAAAATDDDNAADIAAATTAAAATTVAAAASVVSFAASFS